MKTLFFSGAVIAILGLAIAPMSGQTQSTQTSTYVQTTKLVGTKVKSSQGEEIGVIKDVVLDRNTGCMAYTVLSTGGIGTRVTGGGKTVAVPWAVYSPTSDLSVLTVTVDRERIYNAPVFDYARINEYTTANYIDNVYSYYGVSAGVGISGTTTTGTTTTGTTTTDKTTLTSPGASPTADVSPTATASPAATRSPAPTASPSFTESPAATAPPPHRRSPSPEASPATSPRETPAASPGETPPSERGARGAKGRPAETPPPSGRGEPTREGEASPAEAAQSPSEGRKSPRQRERQRKPKVEPGTTPETPSEQE